MILVLEGMDCAGKTTLAKEIQKQWDGESSIIKFPTKDFDPTWKAEHFFADFRKYFPWGEVGTKHLCIIDRFWQSTWVYQGLEGRVSPYLMYKLLPVDLTVMLKVDLLTFKGRIDDASIKVYSHVMMDQSGERIPEKMHSWLMKKYTLLEYLADNQALWYNGKMPACANATSIIMDINSGRRLS